ncbi:MAG: hypothetical protein HQL29_03285 [Candidatus Omnitrophica bacterium]|nr:hypothetical protein [Candidatus Omnitrophota bacterium]
MMWLKWLPWRYLLRYTARKKGFLDPIKLLNQLQRFSQPSEVTAPLELVRSGVVIHARGLINSLAIQHNLDWIWPYWVARQYDPRNEAFIPRAFSLTQINLTHRNWTALGIPDGEEFPIIDPRGLVTPYYDSWSIDAWIIPEKGEPIIPSRRSSGISQKMLIDGNPRMITVSDTYQLKLESLTQVIGKAGAALCEIKIKGTSSVKSHLVVSIRPYNPEGISFIDNIALLEDQAGWYINHKHSAFLDTEPDLYAFSDYHRGDVYSRLFSGENEKEITCKVGMASSAAIYVLEEGKSKEITVSVPLNKNNEEKVSGIDLNVSAESAWKESLEGACLLEIPDEHFKFLYDAAIRTMILHSPGEVYPGPYIYRRFWFRDAAFILKGLLCVGLKNRVRRALDHFRTRQTILGYFLSQEGEWDSNGEALWIMREYCRMSGNVPPEEWKDSIKKAGKWIQTKLLSGDIVSPHAGLLPSGFSAEHLGLNDYYYWDDFWAVAGLRSAAFLCDAYKDNDEAVNFEKEAASVHKCIDQSLKKVEERLKRPAMPASPYRRMDTGAIGSLAGSYPLQVFGSNDPRVLDTVEYLMKNCLVHGGFFHDMTHSGINPYLTLHMAQVLLRAGDERYFALIEAVAKLASPTGQWPEAIHPRTGGGCMGDGQHVWAAAEWVLVIRNCFVREEGEGLILCSGIPSIWLDKKQTISFGPAPTSFGDIKISIKPTKQNILIEWHGSWFSKEPVIDILLPGFKMIRVEPGTNSFNLNLEEKW